MTPVNKRIRAWYTDDTITVYQAYDSGIADAALRAGTFVPPFKPDRMTWIKPSFLWMMYRSGWATKPGQERVLAIEITRDGFDWALRNACLSSFDPAYHADHDDWRGQLSATPVRIQWDPDKDLDLKPQPARAIQIGLGGEAARKYPREWIVGLADRTDLAREIHRMATEGDRPAALGLLPQEREYPVTPDLHRRIGLS
jgi:hypothetical protein